MVSNSPRGRASGVGVYSAGKTDTIFSLSLFLPTLFLLAYFHAINFLNSTTLILKHPMNLLSFSLNLLQMIKPVEQSIPDPLRQAISLSDKYDTYVETSIRDTIKKGELLLCVGPGRSFLWIFISSPAHTAEQNTFLTEGKVGFNAPKRGTKKAKWLMNFRYNPCLNQIHITWFKLLNQRPLVLSLFEGMYRMGTMVAHSAS